MIEPCAYAECTMKSLWDLMPRLVLLCTNIGAAYHDAHHPTVNFCTNGRNHSPPATSQFEVALLPY